MLQLIPIRQLADSPLFTIFKILTIHSLQDLRKQWNADDTDASQNGFN